ncbi:hypothetical protein HMSP1_90 [Sinorhizobium phage HMSP1-Susan]|nr:hypothetical protein HMSP1_90 [Sinorhizobium phage HMSP1-Susan]
MTPDKLHELMREHQITEEIMCIRFNRDPALVREWTNGSKRAPDYIGLAFKALRLGLEPCTATQMRNVRDLASHIGATRENVKYWLDTGQFPIIAKYATAARNYELEPPLTQYERDIITDVYMWQYFRLRQWWIPRPVPGRVIRKLKAEKIADLMNRGYLRVGSTGRLHTTAKGAAVIPKVTA